MNYGSIMKVITIFNQCIDVKAGIPKADAESKYGKIISKLIEVEMTGINDGIDDYVVDTFHAFVLSKKEIGYNMEGRMQRVKDEELLNLILVSPVNEFMEWKDGVNVNGKME